jgi:hypothetical protein
VRPLVARVVVAASLVASCARSVPPSMLSKAILANDLALLDQSLDRGVSPSKPDEAGRPPLVLAAGMGQLTMVDHLITHGADLNQRDQAGQTALIAASAAGFVDIVKRLLVAGADTTLRDVHGFTAHDWVNDQLGHAARGGDDLARERYFEIAALLEKARVDASASPSASVSAEALEPPHKVPHSK